MSALHLEQLPPLSGTKPWPDMTKAERFTVYEQINTMLGRLARELEREIDGSLKTGGCTMRARVRMHMVVDPNDDPRLP